MTADEIMRALDEFQISLEEVAQVSGIELGQLRDWVQKGRVPQRVKSKLRTGIWELRRARVLDSASLPECAWIDRSNGWTDRRHIAELTRHLASCEICQRRNAVLDQEVGPPPITGGPLQRILAYDQHQSGWRKSASRGALLILAMGGLGALVLMGKALIEVNLFMALIAGALLLFMAASGAFGGVVYHWTEPWRRAGVAGHYASGIVTVYGYLLAALGLLGLLVLLIGADLGSLAEVREEAKGFVLAFGVTGLVFGIVFGLMTSSKVPR